MLFTVEPVLAAEAGALKRAGQETGRKLTIPLGIYSVSGYADQSNWILQSVEFLLGWLPNELRSKVCNPYLEVYAAFSRNLRAWLIAFGVGALALLVSQESVSKRLVDCPQFQVIVWAFFVGVAAQILAVLFYKMTTGGIYLAEEHRISKDGRWWKFCNYVYGQQLIEIILDVVAMGAYIVAIYKVALAIT